MENPVFRRAIRFYGEDHQIDKCIEEMGELTQALLKVRDSKEQITKSRLKSKSMGKWAENHAILLQNLTKELADVDVTTEQVKMIFRNSNDVVNCRTEIINKLEGNLNAENAPKD